MAQTRIMVVEDEAVVAKDIVQRLKSLGYEVPAMVATGDDAVKKALQLQPDLILMDIKLKGEMTGIEAAERIRVYQDVPIIYLTAYADSDTLEHAKITGPFGYILKPFEERELRTAIEIAIYKHKMENALRQSEQWLNTTLNSIGDAVIACDTKSCVTFMNPIAESLTGWKQEEAFGQDLNEVFNIVNEYSDGKNANPVARVLAEGVIVGLANHSVLIAKDGRRIPIDDNAAPIRNEKGNVTGVVLVFRDVSERKLAENELKASHERYKKLVGSVTDYIYTVEVKDGSRVRTVHAPGCVAVTGYSPEEFSENPHLWYDMVVADDKPIVEERANKSAAGEVVAPFEHRIIHRDGSERWVRNTQVPRFDANHNLVAYDGLVTDITDRKHSEIQLAKLNECFLNFDSDADKNINRLVAFCGEQLEAAVALYNRLEDGQLCVLGTWNAPPDLDLVSVAEGHICFDVIQNKSAEVTVLRNLQQTKYAQSDPLVLRYGLQTYVGKGVSFGGANIGSFCVVYTEDHIPTQDELKILSIVSSAISVEEKRKRAEEQLCESEANQRMILENINEVVYSIDQIAPNSPNGIVRFVSSRAEGILGYRPEEFIQNPNLWFSLIHPDDVPTVREQTKTILAAKKPGMRQYRILSKQTGVYRCVEDMIVPRLDNENKVIGTFGVARDITEREKAEEEIKGYAEQYRTMKSTDLFGYWLVDENGKLLDVNDNYCSMTGYTKEELLDLTIPDLEQIDKPEDVARRMRKIIETGKDQFESKHKAKDGRVFDVEISTAYWYSQGKFIVFIRDITQRKQAEERLASSENRLRTIIEAEPECVKVIAQDGTLLSMNPAGLRMIEADSSEQVIGLSVYPLIVPEHRQRFQELTKRVCKGAEGTLQFEIVGIKGTRRWLETHAVPFRNEAGHVSGSLGITRDITERKQAEEQLRQSEGRYRELFESTSDLIQVATPDGRLLYANRAWQEALGYTQEEVARLSLRQIFHPDYQEGCFAIISRAASGEKIDKHETVFLTKEGRLVTLEGTIVCRFESGKPSTLTCFLRDITERKRSEKALRESEEKYRSLVDNVNEGIFVTDTKGMLTFANKALARIHGYDNPEQLVDRYFVEFIEPSMRDEIAQRFRNSVQDVGIENIIEATLIKADGSHAYIQIRPTLVRKGERIVGSTGIVQDITGRKEAEEQLRKLSVAVEQSPVSILITDTKGIIEYVNPKFTRISGYTLEEIRGKNVRILKSGETSPEAYKNLWETITAGGEWRGEFRNRKKSGKLYWDFATISPIMNHEGVITHFLSVQEDITKRKQMVEDLRESEERYRRFFEDDLTGDYISTVNGKLLACNPAFARIYGFDSVEEVMKCDANSFYASPRVRDAFINLLREKRKLVYHEEEGRRKDGKAIYLISNDIGIFNENNELVEIKGYIFDNTERRLLEEQLRQSQKMESIGTLAGGIAHDFNNILNNILGFVMQLKKYSRDPVKVLKYSETIEKSTTRGVQLSAHLLTVSRQKKRENVEMDVTQVIDEIMHLCKETFPRSIKVESNVAPEILPVKGDRGSLYQVLLNLTVNARDAMPNGGTLAIEARNRRVGRRDDPSADEVNPKLFPLSTANCIELCVSDTGRGMSEAVREKIFDPFFTTKEHGTGLGLSVVYNAVKDHHGAILVESEEGYGSTFNVYLPAIETSLADGSAPNESSSIASQDALILLVDDEVVMQELGRELLEDNGFRVLIAQDGVEAVEIYRQHWNEISLVILDLVMPRMDGGRAYMELKKINNNLKAFFCSGFTSDKVITQLLEEENLCAIQKPFHPPDFVKMVHSTLKG